jgi:cell division protein FtsB
MQIKTQLETKVKYYLGRMNDLRFVGQLIFVVIVLLVSWSGIKTIQTNYTLQKKISGLQQQNDVKKLENNNLALQNQYFQSDQYLELAARKNFGLAAAGEKLIIVPKDVALSYTSDLPEDDQQKADDQLPKSQHNLESWVDFFLHRQDNN